MRPALVDEPPDNSLEHYLEERALAIALALATTPQMQARIDRLADLRAALMEHRQAYSKEATAKRHARGEIYSEARVTAINGSAREEMDARVKRLYMQQGTSEDVLKVHARTHFTSALVSKRQALASMSGDITGSARAMQAREESFARAWIEAIGDPCFTDEMHALQREYLIRVDMTG